jgi:hypothetical protein
MNKLPPDVPKNSINMKKIQESTASVSPKVVWLRNRTRCRNKLDDLIQPLYGKAYNNNINEPVVTNTSPEKINKIVNYFLKENKDCNILNKNEILEHIHIKIKSLGKLVKGGRKKSRRANRTKRNRTKRNRTKHNRRKH